MRSLIFLEMTALLGVTRKFGTQWRPWEQGSVESEHKADQIQLAILVMEVFRCYPEEWSTLLPCIEFLRANTPHTSLWLTPRDIAMSWSLGSPLSRELAPFETAVDEPLTERARREFAQFRTLRAMLQNLKTRESRRNAELANRHRVERTVCQGDVVLYRDPAAVRKVVGKTPWYRPPVMGKVKSVQGHHADLELQDGRNLKRAHLDNVLTLPNDLADYEAREHLEIPSDTAQGRGEVRSPGEMLEAASAEAAASATATGAAPGGSPTGRQGLWDRRAGKTESLRAGARNLTKGGYMPRR